MILLMLATLFSATGMLGAALRPGGAPHAASLLVGAILLAPVLFMVQGLYLLAPRPSHSAASGLQSPCMPDE
jgi:hypothetical protein